MTSEGDSMSLLPDLARGILALAYRDAASAVVPYPEAIQSALDHIVVSCLLRRETPPLGVPELLRWVREHPVGDLPFDLETLGILAADVLVEPEFGMPTRTCVELASVACDRGWEQEALGILRELAMSVSNYARCSDFLAERPVVTGRQTLSFTADHRTVMTWRHVKDLYQRPSDILVHRGKLHVCPECRLPARSTGDVRVAWCESGECAGLGKPAEVHDPQDTLVLVEPLRAFHVVPARMGRELRSLCTGAGLTTVLPGSFGAFTIDLHGRLRSVRVFDRMQPALLAPEMARTFAGEDSALVVLPARTMGRHPQYRDILAAAVPGDASDAVMTEVEFIKLLADAGGQIGGVRDA